MLIVLSRRETIRAEVSEMPSGGCRIRLSVTAATDGSHIDYCANEPFHAALNRASDLVNGVEELADRNHEFAEQL